MGGSCPHCPKQGGEDVWEDAAGGWAARLVDAGGAAHFVKGLPRREEAVSLRDAAALWVALQAGGPLGEEAATAAGDSAAGAGPASLARRAGGARLLEERNRALAPAILQELYRLSWHDLLNMYSGCGSSEVAVPTVQAGPSGRAAAEEEEEQSEGEGDSDDELEAPLPPQPQLQPQPSTRPRRRAGGTGRARRRVPPPGPAPPHSGLGFRGVDARGAREIYFRLHYSTDLVPADIIISGYPTAEAAAAAYDKAALWRAARRTGRLERASALNFPLEDYTADEELMAFLRGASAEEVEDRLRREAGLPALDHSGSNSGGSGGGSFGGASPASSSGGAAAAVAEEGPVAGRAELAGGDAAVGGMRPRRRAAAAAARAPQQPARSGGKRARLPP